MYCIPLAFWLNYSVFLRVILHTSDEASSENGVAAVGFPGLAPCFDPEGNPVVASSVNMSRVVAGVDRSPKYCFLTSISSQITLHRIYKSF